MNRIIREKILSAAREKDILVNTYKCRDKMQAHVRVERETRFNVNFILEHVIRDIKLESYGRAYWYNE